ncbi:hypothetical protein L1987_03004 [Smallanthus sonchifolius]|uniref:Uncharacterized protein n=1 Tax=Smallanthus sonchifolius TaxID=185202 RepID=A0ACB9K9J4_9ASTR|nr:hypothetical protein L1987_03004 [Smallanthus sonchifolius]
MEGAVVDLINVGSFVMLFTFKEIFSGKDGQVALIFVFCMQLWVRYPMDIDDNDAQDQNLHLVREGSSKVSPVLHSYALPKFDFDDGLQGHLRFDNLVENEGFLDITSQEVDNQWIEEYSRGTSAIQFNSSAVESTRKNVWSEATSSESVELLLKSVGQVKVLKVSDRLASLTNVMDPNFQENFVGPKVSSEFQQSRETQLSGGKLGSVIVSDKHNSTAGEKTIDKMCVGVNQEASKSGKAGTSQHVENSSGVSKKGNNNGPDYSKSEENSMDNSTNSGNIVETRTYNVEKLSVVLNVEPVDKPLVEGSISVNEETKNSVGSDVQQVTSGTSMVSLDNNQFVISEVREIDNVSTCSSPVIPAEDVSNKDETAGNMDINVVGAADSQKNVEQSFSAEGCEGVDAIAQAESNMDVLTDAVAVVESRNVSSDTPDGVQLPSETVAKADVVTEDQPRSPILGVSLLDDDNEKKMQVGFINDSEDSLQKQVPEVEKDTMSDGAEKVVYGLAGDCGSSVGNLNEDPSEQTAEDNSESPLNPKESLAGENGVEPLNLAGIKSIEPSQSAKDKLEVTKGSMLENTSPSSSAKDEKNFTFKVYASAGQNRSLSKNMEFSVSSPSSQLDPVKMDEDSTVSQPFSSVVTEAGSKGNSERKPKKKPVGRETTEKSIHLKEKIPTRRSRKVGKSSPLLTPPATGHVTPVSSTNPGGVTPIPTSNLPVLNSSTSVFHHFFTDYQQVQLRAQILVYGSLLSGMPPEEPHMVAAFGQSDGGRRAWEATWHAYLEKVRSQKSQPTNPASGTPDQGIKIGSAQSKFLAGMSPPIVSPMIPISSPLWNIPTPSDGSQSVPTAFLSGISPLHLYQTPGVQDIAGNNLLWLSQGPFLGQWFASSPISPFNARFPALPVTESIKLTTVKESGAPSIPVIPLGPIAGPTLSSMESSGEPSSDPKSRKRKKVVSSHVTTSAALSPPVSISSKSNPGNFVSTVSPAPTHDQPISVDQNIEKIVTREHTVSKIEESKVQAADAAVHAAAAVNHCQNVWSQLESQKNSGLVSDDEAKLASSAVSIAAASSVAKVAAAAAKIASNVAEQARLMADEVFLSNRKESYDQSSTTSVLSAAKEAARRRIEAASAASKHAENLDAIIKAAELAAEAVSLAGKIVAIGNLLSLRELVEASPEGYWNSPKFNQQGYSDKENIEAVPNDKDDSGDFAKNQMMTIDGSVASYENDKSTSSGHTGPNLSKPVGVISESEFGFVPSDVDENIPQSTSGTWKDNTIKEGCLVEVFKDNNKKCAWFAANVLTLKDGKAFVCYTEIQSDEGSRKLKEWVPLEVEGIEIPRLRIAHPMTTMRPEGTRKRNRTALTDYAWSSGDRVDVWVQDCWCEAVVVDTNKNDVTSLTVQFPAQGETSVVRSWHVRSTLIWKDGKWIEWCNMKGSHSSEGDTPHEKRQKFSTPVVEGKEKAKLSNSVNHVKSGIQKNSTRSGLQRERSRVVFGVPKPGKQQKFMDVSTHCVAGRNDKSNVTNDSVKLINKLMPQAPGSRGSKNSSENDAKEKQVPEVKSKVIKSTKLPIPSFKTLTQKDKLKPSKPTSHDAYLSDENFSGQLNMMDFDSSNPEDVKKTSTSKAVGKTASADRKATKVAVKVNVNKSTSEVEPRRSIRRIQPTSRLLEGLQSSLTVSKLHTVSHASQKSHKVTSKGSNNPS